MELTKMKAALPALTILLNEPLSNYTFTKTGGPADALVFPKTQQEVEQTVNYCLEAEIPWLVLGNASNLIVRDGGITGVVIMLTALKQMTVNGTTITVDAGASLIETSRLALAHHLTGLEFACGIPGSIGGAIYMNAGAYGGEIVDVFESADILWADGTVTTLSNAEMDFAYRHSRLQAEKGIVLRVTFALAEGEEALIAARMAELTALREEKQPLEYPSCGSVFKRPEGHFTGKLIQDADLQGLTMGGAQISMKHAGFIVNINQATATDYIQLIAHIQEVIYDTYQVRLETEVRIIGNE